MRILVTGGAGFIGSHLIGRLLDSGDEVIVVDNLVTGSRDNVSLYEGHPAYSFVQHDISTPYFPPDHIDAVYHLASPASPNPNSPFGYPSLPIPTLKVGALGTHIVLGIAREHNARMILASTSEIYGDPQVHPQREDYWGHVDPIGPRSMYDEAKRFAEAITMAYHRFHDVNTGIVRIFNTYGPRMRIDDGRVIPNFISQALAGEPLTIYGDGNQTRSFCYVDDLVDGLCRMLTADIHLPVNLGNPREMTIRELAEAINEITGNPGGIRVLPDQRVATDPERRRPDVERAKETLGWEATTPLEVGLRRTIADFRARLAQEVTV